MSIKQTITILRSIIVLLTVLVFIQSCEKPNSTNLLGTIILTANQTQKTLYQGKSITLTASDFKDSRCPINADCVSMGYVSVKVTFKDDVKEQDLTLCLGDCNALGVSAIQPVTLNGTVYKVKLDDVTPYHTLDKTKQEVSQAKITISE